MMIIRSIAVDDEPLALRIIEKYVAEVPRLELIETCQDAFSAMEVLRKEAVDLIFLDINMPKLSGISLLKTLPSPPLVVFTTAYPEHAVEGFELEAVDYLLKPFSLERFIKAVNRAAERLSSPAENSRKPEGHLLVKADKKIYRVEYSDIRFVEAFGDYVKIHTKDKVLVPKTRLTALERELPGQYFFRIHRSYIIALNEIEFMEGNRVKTGEVKLPVSAAYREELMEKLKHG